MKDVDKKRLVLEAMGWTKTTHNEDRVEWNAPLAWGGGRTGAFEKDGDIDWINLNRCHEIHCPRPFFKEADGLCFYCNYWLEQLDGLQGLIDMLTFDHFIDSRPRPGHNGLWSQGVIPKHFRQRFINTGPTRVKYKSKPDSNGVTLYALANANLERCEKF